MPPLELRGRYLMREYWADAVLFTRTTADVRELYQGLWMLCDDEGWMRKNIAEIAASLYRFEAPEQRNASTASRVGILKALGKVKTYRCGCMWLPSVARYPRAGKKSAIHAQAHQTHSKGFKPPTPNGFEPIQTPLPVRPIPTKSSRARAREDGAARDSKNGLPFAFEDVVKEESKP